MYFKFYLHIYTKSTASNNKLTGILHLNLYLVNIFYNLSTMVCIQKS